MVRVYVRCTLATMNDRPVPPALPTSDAADRLAEALRFRRMFFAISFAVGAVLETLAASGVR